MAVREIAALGGEEDYLDAECEAAAAEDYLVEQVRRSGSLSYDETFFSSPYTREFIPLFHERCRRPLPIRRHMVQAPVVMADPEPHPPEGMLKRIVDGWHGPTRSMLDGRLYETPRKYFEHLVENRLFLADQCPSEK